MTFPQDKEDSIEAKSEIKIIMRVLSSVKQCEINSINASGKKLSEEYDLDSLAFMQFITALEIEFNMEFEDDATYEELNDINYLIKEIKKQPSLKNPVNN